MMAEIPLTDSELAECKKFLQNLVVHGASCSNKNTDKLIDNHFESLCFCVTDAEITGEIIDIINRYLHYKNCPDVLIPHLIKYVEKKFRQHDVSPFKLEREENDLIEYNASSLAKGLHEVFISSCLEFLDNIDCMTLTKNSKVCHVSIHAVRNKRRKMEDRHIYYTDLNSLFDLNETETGQAVFGVFDGHGGVDAANYAASQLLIHLKSSPNLISQPGDALHKAILKTDEEFVKKAKREKLRSGATAVVVLIQGINLTVAWLGDSQVVLCKAGDALQLMEPHKPDRADERARIESLGGCVVFFGGWRVNGSLAVSRSIGDSEQKPYITGEPDVEEYEMEGDEEFIILACDGLWDCVEPFDAVQLVRECVSQGIRNEAAHKLVDLAIEQRSMDNISVLVVYFDFNELSVNSTHQNECNDTELNVVDHNATTAEEYTEKPPSSSEQDEKASINE